MKTSLKLSLFALLGFVCLTNCAQPEQEGTTRPVSKVSQLEWSKSASIYEVNIRQFSEEGTIAKVQEQLPRLKDMGITILWLMPIHPIGELNRKGGLGSYYAVQDYTGFAPEYGTKEDLQAFVDAAHELDMKVIIDWVANHTAWDNPWTENKAWYELDEDGGFMPPRGTDWSDVIQLDYENEEMRQAMIDAMVYWVEEHDIDGFRCDVAGMVPTDFWVTAVEALNEVKPVFMLAEDGGPELVTEAFQMNYAWHYAHDIREMARGERTIDDIVNLLEEQDAQHPATAYRMYFTSNHDENSWKGSDPELFGDNFENFAVLSATISGMPLIYNGQESGLDKRLEFFEKDPIDWKEYKYEAFYTDLLALKRENQALWNGAFGGELTILDAPNDEVMVYSRKKDGNEVVVALNFGTEAISLDLSTLNVDDSFTAMSADDVTFDGGNTLEFPANEWIIFSK